MPQLKNISLIYCLIFHSVIFLFTYNIPFFWDSPNFSGSALNILTNNNKDIVPPSPHDLGNFPLYPLLLKLFFSLFSENLFYAHLLIFFFVTGILIQSKKLFELFLNPTETAITLLICSIQPILITQSIILSYDIVFTFFFLTTINNMIKNNLTFAAINLTFLSLTSIRGMIVAIFISIVNFFFTNKSDRIRFVKLLSIPIIINVSWLLYHKIKTGWFLFSPERVAHREFVTFEMFVRQIFYSFWKLADFGNIIIWILTIIFAFRIYKTKFKINQQLKKIFFILTTILILYIITLSSISNPIGHKYFLPFIISFTGIAVYTVSMLKSKFIKIALFLTIPLILFSGNFIYYPTKYGNGWDSSLKVLPYFNLKQKLDSFIITNNIDPSEVGVEFPLFGNSKYFYLNENFPSYEDIDKKPLDKWKYVILTNISNSYTEKEIEFIRNNYKLIFSTKKDFIYIELYKNLDF